MAKTAKKAAKKVSHKSSGDHAERRERIIKMLLRKTGATLQELMEAGHNQPAQAALRIAETRGLKTKTDKAEGDVTRYYATGTPTPAGTKKAGVKKAAAKKPAKKVAKKKVAKKAAKKAPAKKKAPVPSETAEVAAAA